VVKDAEDYDPFSTPSIEAIDQEFLVNAAREQSFNSSSPLYGLINNQTGAMGHSMGGGSTVITGGTGLVQSLMTLSAEYDDAVGLAAKNTTIPSLVMTGSDDCICPAPTNAIPIFKDLNSPCKYYVNIMNATHCHFDEVNQLPDSFCELVEKPCLDGHQLPRETQWAFVQRYVLSWFDFTLKGDLSAQAKLNSMISSDLATGLLFAGSNNCTNFF